MPEFDPRKLYQQRLTDFYEGGPARAEMETVRALLYGKLVGVLVIFLCNLGMIGLFCLVTPEIFSSEKTGLAMAALLALISAASLAAGARVWRAFKLPLESARVIAKGRVLGHLALFTSSLMWLSFIGLTLLPRYLGLIGKLG